MECIVWQYFWISPCNLEIICFEISSLNFVLPKWLNDIWIWIWYQKKELDNEWDTLYEIKSKGAQIRWRVKWNDEGEKNHLENKHQSKNVKVSNVGSTFVKTYDIINEVCKFYENLYSSKDIPDMKLNHILPELIHPLCYQKMMKNIVKISRHYKNAQKL